jgi:hypothetical protein
VSFSAPGPHYRAFFRPYGKMHRTITFPKVVRALRMLDRAHDRTLAQPETEERALHLCEIERRRTALANLIGAC